MNTSVNDLIKEVIKGSYSVEEKKQLISTNSQSDLERKISNESLMSLNDIEWNRLKKIIPKEIPRKMIANGISIKQYKYK